MQTPSPARFFFWLLPLIFLAGARADDPFVGTVTGWAITEAGEPVAGARVTVISWPAAEFGSLTNASLLPHWTSESHDDGSFEVGGVWSQRCTLVATAPNLVGHAIAHPSNLPARIARVVMRPSASLRGRIVDLDGKPVADAQVLPTFAQKGSSWFDVFPAMLARTDSDGFFAVGNFVLPTSLHSCQLLCLKPGYAPAYSKLTVADSNVSVTMTSGGSLCGTVRFHGKPLMDVQVIAGQPYLHDFKPYRSVSDRDGNYRITGLAPGPYQVAVDEEYYFAPPSEWITVVDGQESTGVDFDIDRAALLSIKATDLHTGEPVQGRWQVRGADSGEDASTQPPPIRPRPYMYETKSDGCVRIVGRGSGTFLAFPFSTGDYIPYFAIDEKRLAIAPGQEAHLQFALRRGGKATILVSDELGNPVEHPEIKVEFRDYGLPQFRHDILILGKEIGPGQFIYRGLPTGGYRVVSCTLGKVQVREIFFVVASEDDHPTVHLTLRSGREFSGRVVDETGKGIAAAEVRSGSFFYALTGKDGKFSAIGMPPKGSPRPSILGYSIRVYADGFDTFDSNVMRQSMTVPATITLKPTGTTYRGTEKLDGLVLDERGMPVKNALVSASQYVQNGGKFVDTRSSSDGRFKFDELLNTEVRLHVDSDGGIADGYEVGSEVGKTDVRLGIIRHARVTGRVLDRNSHHPLLNYIVQLTSDFVEYRDQWSNAKAFTEPHFTINAIGGSKATIIAKSDGYFESTPVEILPKPGEVVEIPDIELEPSGSVAGVVRDEKTSIPIAGATVFALPASTQLDYKYLSLRSQEHRAATNDNGEYRFQHLPFRYTKLYAIHDSFSPALLEDVQVRSGLETRADLVMSIGATIRGSVTLKEKPLARVYVEISSLDPEYMPWKYAITGPDGTYEIKGVPPCSGILSVIPEGENDESIGRLRNRFTIGGDELTTDGTLTINFELSESKTHGK